MTQHTKFKNDKDVLNHDGTIKTLEIGKKLTIADIKKITDKFPELKGKEIE